ncbi:hypothetical protein ACWD25_47890 [Streptomyces sp. NPDC002920]
MELVADRIRTINRLRAPLEVLGLNQQVAEIDKLIEARLLRL